MRKLAVALVAALAGIGLVVAAAPAQAGCCVVVALDSMDPPQPGDVTEVRFTTRFNNDPPSNLHDGDELRITLSPNFKANGTKFRDQPFPARPVGEPGHYVADVTFPQAGSYAWAVTSASGARYEFGEITVGDDAAAGAGRGVDETSTAPESSSLAYRGSILWRVALPLLTLAATAYLAAELTGHRRHSTVPTSPVVPTGS